MIEALQQGKLKTHSRFSMTQHSKSCSLKNTHTSFGKSDEDLKAKDPYFIPTKEITQADYPQPGEYLMQLIHRVDPDEVFAPKFDQLLGKLSWSLNPQNELHVFKKCIKDQQLFELLQHGMTFDDKVINLHEANIPPNRSTI